MQVIPISELIPKLSSNVAKILVLIKQEMWIISKFLPITANSYSNFKCFYKTPLSFVLISLVSR